MTKEELRRHYLSLRKAQSDAERAEKSAAVCRRLLSHPLLIRAPLILGYAAVRGELDLSSFYEQICVPIAFPRTQDHGIMEFAVMLPSELVRGRFGIPEPSGERPALSEFPAGTVCLVPALVYDADGYRLGYGGGYYDRFLASFRGVTVGIADAIAERLPRGEYDLPVSMICSDLGVTLPRSGKA
ncbi:MAG: 5-formyltetrahydrofolate cyclo-ligase [Clostridia bacterium]|nr:5-formyltetrahydrofolate cyclo-ligase [Clostridia bacterium]